MGVTLTISFGGDVVYTSYKMVDNIYASGQYEIKFDDLWFPEYAGNYVFNLSYDLPGIADASTTINVNAGMRGTYTIGTPTASYADMYKAVVDLYKKGVAGPIVFEFVGTFITS